MNSNPLSGLLKIDIISAQRGFLDTSDDNGAEGYYHL